MLFYGAFIFLISFIDVWKHFFFDFLLGRMMYFNLIGSIDWAETEIRIKKAQEVSKEIYLLNSNSECRYLFNLCFTTSRM